MIPVTSADHSLFINSGGNIIDVGGNEYEEDLTPLGPSYFYSSSEKWAYSITGLYMGNDVGPYVTTNTSYVSGEGFYTTGCLTPTSVKYYGLCMRRGSYRVRLHFAEIMYSNDTTFSSLEKCIFDVSIQVSTGPILSVDFYFILF